VRGDALKSVVAKVAANGEPTDEELGLALAEGVDILLAFFSNIGRIADAVEGFDGDFARIADAAQTIASGEDDVPL